MNGEPELSQIERLDLSFTPAHWPFAQQRRAEIDAYFEASRRDKPHLWNGRVLLLYDYRIENGALHGAFLETDFASFYCWRAWGCPPAGVWDCFGSTAVVSGDGAVLLGEMATHTANAGLIYFPCGTPDLDDIIGGRVDLDHNIARELKEETGLDLADLTLDPGWTMMRNEFHIAIIKTAHAQESAEALQARVAAYLAKEREPELAAIRLVWDLSDLNSAMPQYVWAFLSHRWRRGTCQDPTPGVE